MKKKKISKKRLRAACPSRASHFDYLDVTKAERPPYLLRNRRPSSLRSEFFTGRLLSSTVVCSSCKTGVTNSALSAFLKNHSVLYKTTKESREFGDPQIWSRRKSRW